MSYNISQWKTKKLDNLIIPLDALHYTDEFERRGYKVEHQLHIDGDKLLAEVRLGEGGGLGGEIDDIRDPLIKVTQIALMGEGSGTDYHEVLLRALRKSTGVLEAVLIWEGGDSISRLIVRDGVVKETPYEL